MKENPDGEYSSRDIEWNLKDWLASIRKKVVEADVLDEGELNFLFDTADVGVSTTMKPAKQKEARLMLDPAGEKIRLN